LGKTRTKTRELPVTLTEKVVYYSFVVYAVIISILFIVTFLGTILSLLLDPSQIEAASFGYAEGGYFD